MHMPADDHCKPTSVLRPVDAGLADAAVAFLRKLLLASVCTAGAFIRKSCFFVILKADDGFVLRHT